MAVLRFVRELWMEIAIAMALVIAVALTLSADPVAEDEIPAAEGREIDEIEKAIILQELAERFNEQR